MVESGASRRGAARHLKVSASFAVKLVDRILRTGSAEPARQGRPPGSGKLAAHLAVLLDWVEADPDITMPELPAKLAAEKKVTAHPASLSRVLLKAGLSFEKTLLASETEREDVRQAREEWKAHRQPRMRENIHRLVFLDETGTTTKMTRLRGRARRGTRLKADAPFGHWATQTFIAGLRCDGLTAPWVIDHPMNRETYDTYVETQLAPTLRKGDVVILDNLASHKSAKAEAILEAAWRLVPLPAALQSRSQSDRNGLRQTQGPPAPDRRQDNRRPMEDHRRHLCSLLRPRVLELLPARRICARLIAQYSSPAP